MALKSQDYLSSYAVRLLNNNFVDSFVEYYLTMTQMSGKSKSSPKIEFCWKFRVLYVTRKHSKFWQFDKLRIFHQKSYQKIAAFEISVILK